MRSWRQTIYRPNDGRAFELKKPAAAIRVIRGGWAGLRITFDQDDDPALNANSFELTNGAFIVNEYDRAFIRWPAVFPPFPVELEFYSCAELALTPELFEPPPMQYEVLSRGLAVSLTEPINQLAALTSRSSIEDGRSDRFRVDVLPGFPAVATPNADVRPFYTRASTLDGMISSSGDFDLLVWGQMDRAGTKRSLIGSASPAAVNAFSGLWEVSLATGITPAWSSGRSPGPVPLPPYGVEIEVRIAAPITVDWLFWTRSL